VGSKTLLQQNPAVLKLVLGCKQAVLFGEDLQANKTDRNTPLFFTKL